MRYLVYNRSDVSKPMMVCYGDEAFFKFLARYQTELKSTRKEFREIDECLVLKDFFNNPILDSVYLGCGDGQYAILNEYGSFVDPRNYYDEILKYRKYYRYNAWFGRNRGVLLEEEQKLDFVYRRGPVPGTGRYPRSNMYRNIKFGHLLKEVSHEDHAEYSRPKRKQRIIFAGGIYSFETGVKSSHGDRCWKRQKIKKQYMKHPKD